MEELLEAKPEVIELKLNHLFFLLIRSIFLRHLNRTLYSVAEVVSNSSILHTLLTLFIGNTVIET